MNHKNGDQDPNRPGLIYSEASGKFVSRAEYNATRPGRDREYNIVQARTREVKRKRKRGEDGPLDYFNLQYDLFAYISQHCTDQNVLNLIDSGAAFLLNRNLEQFCNAHPDKHGLTAREDQQKDLVRYWLVEEFNERGYTSSRPGMNNKVARAYALAMMDDQDMPAGKGRDGKPLSDEALKAAVKRIVEWHREQDELKQQIERLNKPSDLKKRFDLIQLLDEDQLPDWAITVSERQGIQARITLGYVAELQRKYPHLPRPK
jgi:hypothetical protein